MDTILLIGGAPLTGKSLAARKLSDSLKLPWISTDTIRGQMRKIVRKKDFPALFDHAEATPKMAVSYLTKNTASQIVNHSNKENTEVWRGVKALIEEDQVWESFIVEGVAVLPSLIYKLKVKNKKIISLFLVDENEKRIRKRIFSRGLWDDVNKYPDSVKEKEVAGVMEYNKYILSESKKYGCKIIKIDDSKKYIQEIKKLL